MRPGSKYDLNDDHSDDFLIFRSIPMQNSSTQTNANPQTSDQNQQDVVKDICAKWSKFTHQDASAFKGKADLVSQVAAKYNMDQAQAQREVDAVLKGRQIGAGA